MHLLFLFCTSTQAHCIFIIITHYLIFKSINQLIDSCSNQKIKLLEILGFMQQMYLSNNFYTYCLCCSAFGYIFQISYFNLCFEMFIPPNLLRDIIIIDGALLKFNLLLHFNLLSWQLHLLNHTLFIQDLKVSPLSFQHQNFLLRP
jgi:hypothetical protein